jgi:leader peptidase (prepilin peptidase)/N-methyltransferase
VSLGAGTLAAFAAGLVVGAFVDRMIVRLPLGRSLWWPPREHCERCFAPLPFRWSVPLLGWILCRGRCPRCRSRLRRRAAVVHAISAGLFATLYFLYFRGGEFPFRPFDVYSYPQRWDDAKILALFVYHAVLLSLLVAATFIDFDWMIIPDSVTVPGMLVGVLLGAFWFVELHPVPVMDNQQAAQLAMIEESTLAAWFGPEGAPAWAERAAHAWNSHWKSRWNVWSGLVSGVVGLLAGGAVVWVVRAVCSWILRVEAMGFGDVTLMAMVGAFLGWQMALIAFFLAPLSAVVVSLGVWLLTGNRMIPYGPHLSIASAACIFFLNPIWNAVGEVFQHAGVLLFVLLAMVIVLALVTSLIQGVKIVASQVRRKTA